MWFFDGILCSFGILCLIGVFTVPFNYGRKNVLKRKLIHISVSFEWLAFYFFNIPLLYITVCSLGVVLSVILCLSGYASIKDEEKSNSGIWMYALSMLLISIVVHKINNETMLFWGVSAICTSFGDGAAGLIGGAVKKHNPVIIYNKTILGALSNLFISSLLIFAFVKAFNVGMGILTIMIIAVVGCLLELVAPHGFDNITVPLGTFATQMMLSRNILSIADVMFIILLLLIYLVVKKKQALTTYAIIGALSISTVVYVAFGWKGFFFLALFFCCTIITDRIGRSRILNQTPEKSGRKVRQVFANGIIPLAAGLGFLFSHRNSIFVIIYVASVIEAFADTTASNLGRLSGKAPIDICRWRRIEPGLSGGVSACGTLSSLAVCLGCAVLYKVIYQSSTSIAAVVGAAGFIGMAFDSVLGSLFQAKYECSVCGKVVEYKSHCGEKAELTCGWRVVDNNIVNLLSSSAAGLIALIAYIAMAQ